MRSVAMPLYTSANLTIQYYHDLDLRKPSILCQMKLRTYSRLLTFILFLIAY